MQPVPCLRISERPVRFPSDHNTRWRLFYSQKQKTRNQFPAPGDGRRDAALCARVQEDGDSTGDPRTRLGNCYYYYYYYYYAMCCYFPMNDTLFKSFSMHLYILSYRVYWMWVRSCGILSCITSLLLSF